MSEPPFQIAQHNFVTHFDSTTYSIVCKKEETFFFMTFVYVSRQFLLFLSFHCWTITEWQWQEIQAFFWWWSYHHLNVKVKLPIVVNYHFNFLYKWIFNPLISKVLQALKSMRWGKPLQPLMSCLHNSKNLPSITNMRLKWLNWKRRRTNCQNLVIFSFWI